MEELGFETRRYAIANECPCGKSNKDGKFAPFKGMEKYGKCHSCDQTFFPPSENSGAPVTNESQKYIDPASIDHSQVFHGKDPFFKHFAEIVGDPDKATEHLLKMNVGHRAGATVFWLIDDYGRICSIKSFKYDDQGNKISIVPESLFNLANNYYPSLFNACAINDGKTIIIVESEKSAAIASYFFPEYTWIGAGGANGLSPDKAMPLKGRDVIIMYDSDDPGRTGAAKAFELLKSFKCNVKDLDLYEDRVDGYDIADLIYDRSSDEEFMNKFLRSRLDKVAKQLILGNDVDDLEAGIIEIDEDDMVYRYLHDLKDRGETSHFHELDEAFKWKRGLVYTYTGYAGTGKSEINLFLAFLKAMKSGWRFIIFVPESMSSDGEGKMTVDEVYDTLIHIYWGKPVDITDAMHVNEAQYREAIRFIKEHFTIIYPHGGLCNQEQIIKQADYVLKTRGKHDCIIIDPWNNVSSQQEKMELLDDYLRRMISDAKRFAINNRLAWVYVTHPSKPTLNKDGSLPPLDMYGIRGGMSFANGSDFVIVTDRPYYFKEQVEYNGGLISGRNHPEVHFQTRKVKNQKLLGCRPNTIVINFNKITNRYENDYKSSPLDEAYQKSMTAESTYGSKLPVDENRQIDADFTITLPSQGPSDDPFGEGGSGDFPF